MQNCSADLELLYANKRTDKHGEYNMRVLQLFFENATNTQIYYSNGICLPFYCYSQ
jgi:hypothetical protein